MSLNVKEATITDPIRKRSNPRVLIAEDNFLIGEFMRQVLIDLGYAVVGPFTTLEETLQNIETTDIDGAVLDVQLGADNILPAAQLLELRRIPFIVTTGHEVLADQPSVLANAMLLVKPFEVKQLAAMVTEAFGHPLRGEP
jgi:DNA-binding response OmpR family regulator